MPEMDDIQAQPNTSTQYNEAVESLLFFLPITCQLSLAENPIAAGSQALVSTKTPHIPVTHDHLTRLVCWFLTICPPFFIVV